MLASSPSSEPDGRRLGRILESSDGFQVLIRSIPDAVLAVDPEGYVRYASHLSETYLGRQESGVIGASFLELFHEGDRSVFPPVIARSTVSSWDVRSAADPSLWLNVAVLTPSISGDVETALEGSTLFLVRNVPGEGDLLRDRTDLLRRALDSANNIIVVSDPQAEDNPLVFANEYFFKVTGYTRDEVIGRNCRFLQFRGDGTRDDDQAGLRELRRALAAGEKAHVVLRNYRKDGELFYNELFVTPIYDATGQVSNFVGVQNDITDRVKAQNEAATQTSLLRAFYDSAPVLMGVVELQPEGVLHRTANTRAHELFGIPPEAVMGKSPSDLGFTEAEERRWEDAVRACAESGRPHTFDTAHPWDADADDQDVRSLRVTVSRIRRGGTDQPDALFSYIGEDVTDSRRSAAQLRLLATAIESAGEAIVITDAETSPLGPRVIYVNPAHQQLFGYPPDEVVGQTPRMFQGPETDRAVLDRIRRRINEGRSALGEVVNYRKDGTPFVLQWEISPVRDEAGELTNWVGIQRDVTDRRQLEHEVLEAAGREQEWMAREIHDGLGQILTGSGIQLHLLERALRNRDDAQLADDAARISGYIASALDQARTISRGLFPVTVEAGELRHALEHLCTELSGSLGVKVAFQADGTFVLASAERAGHLYRIVQEAVTNATRHGQAQRVDVVLSHDGTEGTLSVRDDGTGIPDHALERGGGLGMRTMAYRARRVGGVLDVHPRPDGGTEVQVRFAILPAPAD